MKNADVKEFLAAKSDDEFMEWLETSDQLPAPRLVEERVNAIKGPLYHQAAALLILRGKAKNDKDRATHGYVEFIAPTSVGKGGGRSGAAFRKDLRKGSQS